MSSKNCHHRPYEKTFHQVAVEFVDHKGISLELAAAEPGVGSIGLPAWKRRLGAPGKSVKALSGMAQLRAENESLRSQIVSLQTQWDVLKTTLGVLSTTICSHEAA